MDSNDNKRKLYDALSQDYDMGSYEQFCADIQNDDKRKRLYDATSEEYDFGSYDSFSGQLGFGKQVETQHNAAAVHTQSVQPASAQPKQSQQEQSASAVSPFVQSLYEHGVQPTSVQRDPHNPVTQSVQGMQRAQQHNAAAQEEDDAKPKAAKPTERMDPVQQGFEQRKASREMDKDIDGMTKDVNTDAVAISMAAQANKIYNESLQNDWRFGGVQRDPENASLYVEAAMRDANEKRDTAIKQMTSAAMGQAYAMVSKDRLAELEDMADESNGMFTAEDLKTRYVESIASRISDNIQRQLIASNMPQSDLAYIMRGINSSIVGNLLRFATSTPEQIQREDAADQMYAETNGVSKWSEFGRGTVTLLSDAWMFGPTGRLGGAAYNAVGKKVVGAVAGKALGRAVEREAANMYLANTIGGKAMSYAGKALTQGGIGLGSFNVATEAGRQLAARDLNIGALAKEGLKGYTAGAILGVGNPIISKATGAIAQKAGSGFLGKMTSLTAHATNVAGESALFAANDVMYEPEISFTDAAIGGLPTILTLKLHGAVSGAMHSNSPITFVKEAIRSLGKPGGNIDPDLEPYRFTDDQKRELSNSMSAKNFIDALTKYDDALKGGVKPHVASDGTKTETITEDPTEAQRQAVEAYKAMMADPDLEFGIKQRMHFCTTGEVLRMPYALTYYRVGNQIITMDKNGSVIARKTYDKGAGLDEAQAELDKAGVVNVSQGETVEHTKDIEKRRNTIINTEAQEAAIDGMLKRKEVSLGDVEGYGEWKESQGADAEGGREFTEEELAKFKQIDDAVEKSIITARGMNYDDVQRMTDAFNEGASASEAAVADFSIDAYIASQAMAEKLGLSKDATQDQVYEAFLNGSESLAQRIESMRKEGASEADINEAIEYAANVQRMSGVAAKMRSFADERIASVESAERSVTGTDGENVKTGDIMHVTYRNGTHGVVVVGDIVLNEDGTIDRSKSEKDIYVRADDAENAELVDLSSIESVDAVFDATALKTEVERSLQSQVERMAAGTRDFFAGDKAWVLDESGNFVEADVKGVFFNNANGRECVGVEIDGNLVYIYKDTMQDYNAQWRIAERKRVIAEGEKKSEDVVEAAESERSNENAEPLNNEGGEELVGQTFVVKDKEGNDVDVVVTNVENGRAEVLMGDSATEMSVGELRSIITEIDSAGEGVKTGNVEQPSGDGTALSRIPKDKNGAPILEGTDPETAWDGIVEYMEGEADAREFVESTISALENDVAKATKAVSSVKPNGDMADFKAKKQAAREALAEAESRLNHWKAIDGVTEARALAADEAARQNETKENETRTEQGTAGQGEGGTPAEPVVTGEGRGTAPVVDERAGAEAPKTVADEHPSAIGTTSSTAEVQQQRENMNTEPTEAQKEAGNYKKGRIQVDGHDIVLENPKGSTRRGKDADGTEWSVEMKHDYGYIKGVKGVDGDEVDVYLSDTPTEGNVFVVDQVNQKTGAFDEHKVMYGFGSMEEAVRAYRDQYEDGWKVGRVTEIDRETFKQWLNNSSTKRKPFADYAITEEKRLNEFSGDERLRIGGETTSEMQQMRGDVEAKASEMGIGDSLVIHNSADDISFDSDASDGKVKLFRNAKGWYDPATGKVHVVLGNNDSVSDAVATMRHEYVAHKNMRDMLGVDDFNTFCKDIWKSAMNDEQRAYEARYSWDTLSGSKRKKILGKNAGRKLWKDLTDEEKAKVMANEDFQVLAADEYTAHMSESGAYDTDWSRMVQMVREYMKSAGMRLELSDADIRTLLSRGESWLRANGGETPMYVPQRRDDEDMLSYAARLSRANAEMDKAKRNEPSRVFAETADATTPSDVPGLSKGAAAVKEASGYSTPEERVSNIERFSQKTAPIWAEKYLSKNGSDRGKEVVRSVTSFYNRIAADHAVKDKLSLSFSEYGNAPGLNRDGIGPLRKNVEYYFTFDMDTTCPRTMAFLSMSEYARNLLKRPMTIDETQNLIEVMRANGLEIPCVYCYAENKRQALSEAFITYMNTRQSVINAANDTEAAQKMYGHRKANDVTSPLTDASVKVMNSWRSGKGLALYNPTMEQLYSDYGNARDKVLLFLDLASNMGEIHTGMTDDAIAKKICSKFLKPEDADYAKLVESEVRDIANEWRYDVIEQKTQPHPMSTEHRGVMGREPKLRGAAVATKDIARPLAVWNEMGKYGKSSSSAHNSVRYMPYTNELRNDAVLQKKDIINAMGGFRLHSSNDFRIDYVGDYFQFFADLAQGGWKSHSYSKSPLYVELFGNTGARINMSIAAYDSNGEVVENQSEGHVWATAMDLRKKYKNAGTMFMTTSADQLQFALDADWVDMIIPFHSSGLPKRVWYNMRAWEDAQSTQNESFFNSGTKKQRIADLKYTDAELRDMLSSMKTRLASGGIKSKVAKVREMVDADPASLDAKSIVYLYLDTCSAGDVDALFASKCPVKEIVSYKKNKSGKVQKVSLRPHFLPGESRVEVVDAEGNKSDYVLEGWLIEGASDAENIANYKRLCDEYGVHPRFHGAMVKDAEGNKIPIEDHPGYIKLIKEAARIDTPQSAVEFNLDKPTHGLYKILVDKDGNITGDPAKGTFADTNPLTGEGWSAMDYAIYKLKEFAQTGGYDTNNLDDGKRMIVEDFVKEYIGKPLGYMTEADKETYDMLWHKNVYDTKGNLVSHGQFGKDNVPYHTSSEERMRAFKENSGYTTRDDGSAISRRAAEAEEGGSFMKSKFISAYHMSKSAFDVLERLGAINSGGEWHHTGKSLRESDFYSWSDSDRMYGGSQYAQGEDGRYTSANESAMGVLYQRNKKQIDKLAKSVDDEPWSYVEPLKVMPYDEYAYKTVVGNKTWKDFLTNEQREAMESEHEQISTKDTPASYRREEHSQVDRRYTELANEAIRAEISARKDELASMYERDWGEEIAFNAAVDKHNASVDESQGKEGVYATIANLLGFGLDTNKLSQNRKGEADRRRADSVGMSHDALSAEYRRIFAEIKNPIEQAKAMTEVTRKYNEANASNDGYQHMNSLTDEERSIVGNNEARFRILDKERDGELIKRLDDEKKVLTYRAMAVDPEDFEAWKRGEIKDEDLMLYPPMAFYEEPAKGRGKKRTEGKKRAGITLKQWFESDENLDKAYQDKKGNWVFDLIKDNGDVVPAAYNPYVHSSDTPLNDQFKTAYKRPNMIVVRTAIPESELRSGYKAERAKDAVGEVEWPSGVVNGKIDKDRQRKVYLSRWAQPLEIMKDADVAKMIAAKLKGQGVAVPSHVVTPSLREALEAEGVPVTETILENGSFIKAMENYPAVDWGKYPDYARSEARMRTTDVIGRDYERVSDANFAQRQPNETIVDQAGRAALEHESGVRFRSLKGEWSGEELSLRERLNKARMIIAEKNADDLQKRNDAIESIRSEMKNINRLLFTQRTYDRDTVNLVADLAHSMANGGWVEQATSTDVRRALAALRNANGKQDIHKEVDTIVELMVNGQLAQEQELLERILKIKTKKQDATGVNVLGKMDANAVQVLNTFKQWMDKGDAAIVGRLEEVQNSMFDENEAVAMAARNEYDGLNLAYDYATKVIAPAAEEAALNRKLEDEKARRRENTKNGGAFHYDESYQSLKETTARAISEMRLDRAEALQGVINGLTGVVNKGIQGARDFKQRELNRIEEIHHDANVDMIHVDVKRDGHRKKDEGFTNWGVPNFMTSSLATAEQLFRTFGDHSIGGEGRLFNRYIRGYHEAKHDYYERKNKTKGELNDIASMFFGDGVKWSDVYLKMRKIPGLTLTVTEGVKKVNYDLTQGNAMYIYMVNKQIDGRMKLESMGITEDRMNLVEETLDPRVKAMADYMQKEYLNKKRGEYNKVHLRLFGAPMAEIDNYVPIRINQSARYKTDADLANGGQTPLPSAKTGAIIERKRNVTPLALVDSDGMAVLEQHLEEMDKWAGTAEFNRDVATLLKYNRFENAVKSMNSMYGGGDLLWDKVQDALNVMTGNYRAKGGDGFERMAMNAAKLVTGAKVTFRVFTAIKQLTSMPAFAADASPELFAKNLAELFAPNAAGLQNTYTWAMENLPMFRERVESRKSGDYFMTANMKDVDFHKHNLKSWIAKAGLGANSWVDAITCAVGARSVYETKMREYSKLMTHEDAHKRAVVDAEIAFNQSQQSSEEAYVTPMQADRTVGTAIFTAFRNGPFGYGRRFTGAIKSLANTARHRETMLSTYARDYAALYNASEEQAMAAAKRKLRRQTMSDLVALAMFGYGLQFVWNIMPSLPYLLAGSDEDVKNEAISEAAFRSLTGPVEGMAGGLDVANVVGKVLTGDDMSNYGFSKLPAVSDIEMIVKEYDSDKLRATNDAVNLLVQATICVNPQVATDAVVATIDACNYDMSLTQEFALWFARVNQLPQSQIEKLYLDEVGMSAKEAQGAKPEELARRYAEYKVMRNSPIAYGLGLYDEWGLMEQGNKQRKNIEKKMKERMMSARAREVNDRFNEIMDSTAETRRRIKIAKGLPVLEQARLLSELYEQDKRAYEQAVAFEKYQSKLNELAGLSFKVSTPEQLEQVNEAMETLKREMVESEYFK